MVLGIETSLKRIATYERVSSDDQKLRETIKNQTEQIARSLQMTEGVRLVNRYADDGVSGTIPMAKRPSGRRLMEDAAKRLFDEVWVFKIDRLGRDDIDPLVVWRELESYGIRVHSVSEGVSDIFSYHIHVAMAAEERRKFIERSAAGMVRTVKEGRFPGGICPLGYEVQGRKHEAKIVVGSRIIWKDWTTADLVRHIYDLLGVEGWTCVRIANHLNALGVPTAYQLYAPGARRAERGTGLQAKWYAGRIRNLVVLTIYKGIYQWGKRSKKAREILEVPMPRLVSDELWQAAQEALARNRIQAKNTPRHYLLTGLMKCGICGKTYCNAHGRDKVVYWRCNGRMTSRYDAENRCKSKGIKGSEIEGIVWNDIQQWLNNPGELIKELEGNQDQETTGLNQENEIKTLETSLLGLEKERKGYLRQNAQGFLGDQEMQEFLADLSKRKSFIEKRLDELKPHDQPEDESLPRDLLEELRRRLKEGLSEEKRQEIARLLVRNIKIKTKIEGDETRSIAEIDYRFPIGAVSTRTDTDS
jgi:site-specific DNA recombinase